jgi:predicted DNA-binding protein
MLAQRPSPDPETLAKKTGRTESHYAREASIECIGDLEALYLAQKRSALLERGKTKTSPLDELERTLDLTGWVRPSRRHGARQTRQAGRPPHCAIPCRPHRPLADPRAGGAALRDDEPGQYGKYRVGDYRITAGIYDGRRVIVVVRSGPRGDV